MAPQEDDRWAGGHIVFYHDADSQGNNSTNYFHMGVIYARHGYSTYAHDKGMSNCYGTCKVDWTGAGDNPWYRTPNFINLADRYSSSDRYYYFVQVNTLVNN